MTFESNQESDAVIKIRSVRLPPQQQPNVGRGTAKKQSKNSGHIIKPATNVIHCCQILLLILSELKRINLFSTNVPFMDKPGSWFLLAKYHSSTGVFQTFC